MFTPDGIKLDPVGVQNIADMLSPTDIKVFQSFHGTINFMQPFVPYILHHTAPFMELLNKKNLHLYEMRQLITPSSGSTPLWPQLFRSLFSAMIIPRPSLYRQRYPAEASRLASCMPLFHIQIPYRNSDPLSKDAKKVTLNAVYMYEVSHILLRQDI